MAADPKSTVDWKQMSPLLVLVAAVVLCGCLSVPVGLGVGLLSYLGLRSSPKPPAPPVMVGPTAPPIVEVESPQISPSDDGSGRQAAQARLLEAEAQYNLRGPSTRPTRPFTSSSGILPCNKGATCGPRMSTSRSRNRPIRGFTRMCYSLNNNMKRPKPNLNP